MYSVHLDWSVYYFEALFVMWFYVCWFGISQWLYSIGLSGVSVDNLDIYFIIRRGTSSFDVYTIVKVMNMDTTSFYFLITSI